MNILWSGLAGANGKQNQYASKFLYGGAIASAAIERAQREGRTIEYTVEVISAKDASGNSLSSIQCYMRLAVETGSQPWINVGEKTTFKIDPNTLSTDLNSDSVIHLLVQNYSVTVMYDVEIWVSPISN